MDPNCSLNATARSLVRARQGECKERERSKRSCGVMWGRGQS